ncbi:MAG: MotE family protein [Candidatus Kapaibacteriales bacterium]
MNLKQVLIIFSIITGSLVIIALILFGLYKFAPGLLGINQAMEENLPNTTKAEFKTEPKVVLSRLQYEDILQKYFDSRITLEENKFLLNYRTTLQDSIKKLNQKIDSISRYFSTIADSVKIKSKLIEEKEQIIKKLLAEIEQKEKQISKFKEKESRQLASGKAITDSARQILYSTFAKIYENSNPKEVAKIFENLPNEHVVAILRLMSKKKAGKIIDALKPERSAAILQSSFE